MHVPDRTPGKNKFKEGQKSTSGVKEKYNVILKYE